GLAGTCHTGGTECNATHNFCANFNCTGNCRDNTDCLIGSSSPYCNPANHQCSPCTASNQCSSGYVCTASTSGACVTGNCSFDVNCGAGQTCVSNSCVQTAPAVSGGGAAKSAPEVAALFNNDPAVVTSGSQGLYYSYATNPGG